MDKTAWHARLKAQLADATAKRERTKALRSQLAEAREHGKRARHARRPGQLNGRQQ